MLNEILKLLKYQNIVFVTGSAGTGKTHLIKEISTAWKGPVLQLAPTGRAARRVQEVTGLPGSTIHSAIFEPPTEWRPLWSKLRKIGGYDHLVIIDEFSMVDTILWTKIQKAALRGTKFVCIGDPNQLQPVNGLSALPIAGDIHLSHVYRNSGGILDFAHDILKCTNSDELIRLIHNPKYDAVIVHHLTEVKPTEWKMKAEDNLADTMLIAFTNARRYQVNQVFRQRMGYAPQVLEQGEKLLVRTNDMTLNVLNGEIITYLDGDLDEDDPELIEAYVKTDLNPEMKTYISYKEMELDAANFMEHRREVSDRWITKYREAEAMINPEWDGQHRSVRAGIIDRGIMYGPASKLMHVQHGYCLTCHSAQGGECDEVGIIWNDDWFINNNFENARSWWYTAATRARNGVNIWFPAR